MYAITLKEQKERINRRNIWYIKNIGPNAQNTVPKGRWNQDYAYSHEIKEVKKTVTLLKQQLKPEIHKLRDEMERQEK